MKSGYSSIATLVLCLASSKALADEPPGSSVEVPPRATPSVAIVRPDPPPTDVPIRPLLRHYAHQEQLRRYGEGVVGVAGAGVLVGAGFVARPHDSSWAYALWITGGVVALGSIGSVFMPSELETLAHGARNASDDELRQRFAELGRVKRVERRVGAVLEGLLGVTSIVVGGLVLDAKLGEFDDHPRRALGSAFVASGALGVVQGAVHWFVPSPLEVGAELAASRALVSLAAAPIPSGFSVAVTGAF